MVIWSYLFPEVIMYIKHHDKDRNRQVLIETDKSEVVKCGADSSGNAQLSVNGGQIVVRYVSKVDEDGNPLETKEQLQKKAQDRFNDIVAALSSEKVVVYDMDDKIGEWNKPTNGRRAKKEAPAHPPEPHK